MTKIHKAILAVMADIATTGIGKTEKNVAQGFQFRGIERAMNALSPLLTKHGITVTPAYRDLQIETRAKEGGKGTRFVTLLGRFEFKADDDSMVVSEFYGEAMDSGDKAVTKAQSVAFRTALFQQFVVPTMAMDPESGEEEDGGAADDWVAYAKSVRDNPVEFAKAKKDAIKAFNDAKDSAGLKAFNAAMAAA